MFHKETSIEILHLSSVFLDCTNCIVENQQFEDMDNFNKYLSYIFLILIFGGLVRLHIFYSCFNIKITEYLKIGETLIIFDYFLIIQFTLLTVLGIKDYLTKENIKMYWERRASLEIETQIPDKEVIHKTKRIFNIIITILFIILLSISTLSYLEKPFLLDTIIILWTGIIVNLFILYPFLENNNLVLEKHKLLNFKQLIHELYFFFLLVVVCSKADAEIIKNSAPTRVVTIQFEDSTLQTNENLVEIGKTENWIFLYSKLSKSTTAYPLDNVKTIEYTSLDPTIDAKIGI